MTAEITPIKTDAEIGLAEAFRALRGRLAEGAIAARREAAFRHFEAQGLPNRRVEDWKYTDLRALMHDAKPLADAPDAVAKARAKSAGGVFAAVDAQRIVFVDGVLVPELSDLTALDPGLKISSLADALGRGTPDIGAWLGNAGPAEGDVAYAINTAFMGDGAVVEVEAGARIARPLHLIFVYGTQRAAAVFSRSLVVLAAGACLTLIESHEGPDGLDYQINTALDLVVGERSRLDRIKVNAEGNAALHLSTLNATIAADANVSDFTFLTGGQVVRSQLFVRCCGTGATLSLNGASLLKDRQHGDTTLLVDHSAGGCQSRELFKSVLDGASRGVFQGKIIVRPGAQKTDARMMTRALLLSEQAEADNKPELEIFADDVQCGHGATSGALDDNLKFYLMARGIPERDAETLLIQSFVGEAIEAVAHEDMRDALTAAALHWLAGRP
ncbi:MAG TPA: Fe-S cluster assembly protein SufD [Xanthobacteraceae bacterium]|nr:Fe-S cluster assembly protein SufD [Xanthobacteraceae bacterium]